MFQINSAPATEYSPNLTEPPGDTIAASPAASTNSLVRLAVTAECGDPIGENNHF